jgi:hypothetical protein
MSSSVDASRVQWRKASRSSSTGDDCVEAADLGSVIALRDSKDPEGPELLLSRSAWRELSRRAVQGELDL